MLILSAILCFNKKLTQPSMNRNSRNSTRSVLQMMNNTNCHHEVTFLTIISWGLHNINPNLWCPSTTATSIHHIIGLGITIHLLYPESAESLDSTIIRYRIFFKIFISNFPCSKIECHVRARSTPKYFPCLQSQT